MAKNNEHNMNYMRVKFIAKCGLNDRKEKPKVSCYMLSCYIFTLIHASIKVNIKIFNIFAPHMWHQCCFVSCLSFLLIKAFFSALSDTVV